MPTASRTRQFVPLVSRRSRKTPPYQNWNIVQRNRESECRVYLSNAMEVRMTEHTTRGRKQDRARVAGGQDHEVRYESEKTGASKQEVKDAVKEVGNSREKLERELGNSSDEGA